MLDTTPTNLPSRLTERAFRTYEPDITLALTQYPNVVKFKPSGNLTTYIARIRDAMKSYNDFHWQSSSIDRALFTLRYDDLIVHQPLKHPGEVWIGGRVEIAEERKRWESAVEMDSSELASSLGNEPVNVKLPIPSVENRLFVEFLARLAQDRLLARPVRVKTEDSFAGHLEQSYDIVVTKNDDGSYTIE